MKVNMTILFHLICFCISGVWLLAAVFIADPVVKTYPNLVTPSEVKKKYIVLVKDEHQVQLLPENPDEPIIFLYLENATLLYDERIIFISEKP